MFRPPAFLVVEAITAERGIAGLGGDPDDYIAIVAGRSKSIAWNSVLSAGLPSGQLMEGVAANTFWRPSYDVNGLGMLGQGC